MSETIDPGHPDGGPVPVRPRLLVLLAALLFVEGIFLALAAIFLLYELLTETPTSYGGALAILVLTALAALWLFVIAVNTRRARPWIRGAALTWQVLQLAVALGSFQGLFARNDVGWFLLVPAVVVLWLLFTKSVMRATARQL